MVRALSALIMAPVALATAWWGGWPFAAMLAVAACLMSWELAGLLFGGASPARGVGLALTVCLAVFFTTAGLPLAALGVGVAGLALEVAYSLWRGWPRQPAFMAYPYLVLPFVALVWLRADPVLGREATLWILGVVWAIDICAYFSGRLIGGPKLAPRISPKKTWAGLIGGMVGAAIVGVLMANYLGQGSVIWLAIVSASLALVEQTGDFLESSWKRRAGVKDSSNLIPGHGGLLDRVDGLVAACLAAALIGLLHGGSSPAAGVLIWP
ncbi:MAG: phosphatidate cytidylyltransferase [Rhizobiales bacterium]|nr:phosphatidate cytidylyltransferase [Hyphomicrobiales bacterium]